MNKNFSSKRGFSLVELLATILIISLVFGVGFYFVQNTINNSNEKSKLISLSNVKSASELYVREYSDVVPWREDGTGNFTTCILVNDLVNSGFLKEDKIKDLSLDSSITLTKNSSNTIIDVDFSNVSNCNYNRIAIPTSKKFCMELEYNGDTQILTNDNVSGFEFVNNTGKDAGRYVVIAKLIDNELYWKDGTRGDKKITCTIKKAIPYFAMHPTGISSDDINIGEEVSSTIRSGVNGTLKISNSNSDYLKAFFDNSNDIIENRDKVLKVSILANNKKNAYLRITLVPDDIKNYQENTLTYTVGNVNKKAVDIPNDRLCVKNLYYKGIEQQLVSNFNFDGYSLFDVFGTDAGDYTITAKLNYGYYWKNEDNSSDDVSDKTFKCNIKESYVINYDGNGNTGGNMNSQTCKYNEDCTLSSNQFVKSGYNFVGWSKVKNGTKLYNNGHVVRDLEDGITLYAVWVRSTVDVTFNTGNILYGIINRGETVAERMKYSISNGTITVTANNNDGYGTTTGRVYLERGVTYTFNGTTNGTYAPDGAGDTVQVYLTRDGINDTQHAVYMYSISNYSFTVGTTGLYYLRLDVNQSGKTHTFSNLSITKNVETKTFEIGSKYTFPSFSVAGHTFTGWYTSLTGGNRVESYTVVSNTTNHTLYARWSPNVCTINFSPNSGTFGTNTNATQQKMNYGARVDNFWNANGGTYSATRTGYHIDAATAWSRVATTGVSVANYNETSGYYAIDICPNLGTRSETVTLNANWNVNVCTITFSPNGGLFKNNSNNTTQAINYGASSGNMRNASGTNGYYNASRSGYSVTGTIAWISSVGKRKYDQDKSYTATDICPSLANGNQSVTLSVNWWRYLYKTRRYDSCLTGSNTCSYGCKKCTRCPTSCTESHGECHNSFGVSCYKEIYDCECSNCYYGSNTCKAGYTNWSSWTTTKCSGNENVCRKKRDYFNAQ